MHTCPCTSITITISLERRLQEMLPSKFIIGRRWRGKQVDRCFNGWQYLYLQKLLEFLMTLNKYLQYMFSTMESNYVLLSSFLTCLPTSSWTLRKLEEATKLQHADNHWISQTQAFFRSCTTEYEVWCFYWSSSFIYISLKHLTSILTQICTVAVMWLKVV